MREHKEVLHELQQGRLGGNCVVHEGGLERVVLRVPYDGARQRVVARQVCDFALCMSGKASDAI